MAIRHENRMDVKEGCHLEKTGSVLTFAAIQRYHGSDVGALDVTLTLASLSLRKMLPCQHCEILSRPHRDSHKLDGAVFASGVGHAVHHQDGEDDPPQRHCDFQGGRLHDGCHGCLVERKPNGLEAVSNRQ